MSHSIKYYTQRIEGAIKFLVGFLISFSIVKIFQITGILNSVDSLHTSHPFWYWVLFAIKGGIGWVFTISMFELDSYLKDKGYFWKKPEPNWRSTRKQSPDMSFMFILIPGLTYVFAFAFEALVILYTLGQYQPVFFQ